MKISSIVLLSTTLLTAQLTLAASPTNNVIRGVGFGAGTTGGNAGSTYTVTNLKDSGTGSLRDVIGNSKRPAIVKFTQCGTIELKSRLLIESGDLTVDGSSCQNGAGIQIKNYPVQLRNVHNVILSNLAFRLGTDAPVSKGTASSSDALEVGCSQDIVLDHLSIYWGTDENLSFYCYPNEGGIRVPVTRISVQHSIIAEALRSPQVLVGEEHTSKGALIDGPVNDITFYGNLFVSNGDRNPEILSGGFTAEEAGTTRVQFVNNMLYHTIYGIRSGREGFPNWRVEVDIVGNYQKASQDKFSKLTDEKPLYLQRTENPERATVYFNNNRTIKRDSNQPPVSPKLQIIAGKGNFENPVQGITSSNILEYAQNALMSTAAPIEILPIDTLEAYIGSTAGKILPCRDPIDRRVINNVLNDVPALKGGQRPVDAPADVGGYMMDKWTCNP